MAQQRADQDRTQHSPNRLEPLVRGLTNQGLGFMRDIEREVCLGDFDLYGLSFRQRLECVVPRISLEFEKLDKTVLLLAMPIS
jgi:hypothetical protein